MRKKKILLLDNNDSFTYNIVDMLRRIPSVSLTTVKTESAEAGIAAEFDRIIISPGPGRPEDFPLISRLIERYCRTKPLLGICLGHQAIGKFAGLKLRKLSPPVHGQAKNIRILKNGGIFKNIPAVFRAGLYHSWVLENAGAGNSAEIIAVSEDGLPMAIRLKDHPVYGVQFHPESYMTEYGEQLLKNFISSGV